MSSQQQTTHSKNDFNYLLVLTLGALGVVYGDIGTSVLYALRECFHGEHALVLNRENLLGVLSLIFWSLISVISIKYLYVVMRADNKGEGGILALMALAAHPQSPQTDKTKRRYLVLIGLFGSALLYGDGIITPAISVLSAVEGLAIINPLFGNYILGITIFILVLLFLAQKQGTAKIGNFCGPIIIIWFLTISLLGICGIMKDLSVLAAINPLHGIQFFLRNGWQGFVTLGSVCLVITGGEALYADMGHFGRKPIKLGWYYLVLPSLLLNYFGQGALLLTQPELRDNPFYNLAPSWALLPLVIIATLATIIASQALISGAFSITKQAVQLGCLPRLEIRHTSSREIGQIYVPLVNTGLLVLTIFLVVGFRSSSNMAAAYGVAVSLTMLITTILTYVVARERWGWNLLKSVIVFGIFLIIDFAFFSANIIKIHHGGWFPLVIGGTILTLMLTWRTGRQILARRIRAQTFPLDRFREEVQKNPPLRVPGTAIFMTGNMDGTPAALIHNLKHNKILHQTVVILSVKLEEVAYLSDEGRVTVENLENNFYKIMIRYGFMETPNVPAIISQKEKYNINIDTNNITYFLGRETILATETEGMAIWREKIFAFMTRNAERATTYYRIPSDQVIEIGLQIEI